MFLTPYGYLRDGTGHRLTLFLFVLTAAITVTLYLPFLDNEIVFDDHNFFATQQIYYHAINFFDLRPRTFPYFTLGFVQVIWGSVEAHRILSLLLHLLNIVILYRLFDRWLAQIGKVSRDKAVWAAFIGSLFFAIHPVAVYGAGYLTQRTMLFATLFSSLCLWFYWRSLERNRLTDALTAAIFYALAIFSKEHAIMLPAVAVLLTLLHDAPWRQNLDKAALFTSLCLPPAILVVLAVKGVIGTMEPESAKFISSLSALPRMDSLYMPWVISGVAQCGIFFQYLQAWLLPDVRTMSADIRVDFLAAWVPVWIAIKVASFALFGTVGFYLLRRGARHGLIGFGMLYTWLLFITEFSSYRFQEPFVLYRSYLWAPGIVLALLAALTWLDQRKLIVGAILAAPLIFISAQDRLRTFKTEQALWEDVVAKLPSKDVIGADRIFYNRGTQYLKAKRYHDAIADFSHSIRQNPAVFQSFQQRGIARYSNHDYQFALADFNHAITLNNSQALSYFGRAMALEKLGCSAEATTAYEQSRDLGFLVAKVHLDKAALTASKIKQRAPVNRAPLSGNCVPVSD